MQQHSPDAVQTLERELRGIFGTRLQSLVVYGIHREGTDAEDGGHGHHAHEAPRTHTMAVVEQLTPDDLRSCTARVGGWHDAGLATPLVLAAHEFERSLDAFPFEFGSILADHVVVAGISPFEGVQVDPADVRRACEVQARGHLLHLRQAYIETRGNMDGLAVLIVRSAGSFAALTRSIARLEGRANVDSAAAARHVERVLALPGTTVSEVVRLVGVKEISAPQAERLFPPYLDAVERLVKYVDEWTQA